MQDIEYKYDNRFVVCNNKNIKRIEILSGATTIGKECFKNCTQLEYIKLPNSLNEIGDCAFENCISLKSIILPRYLQFLTKDSFKNCENLNIFIHQYTIDFCTWCDFDERYIVLEDLENFKKIMKYDKTFLEINRIYKDFNKLKEIRL